jgi:serine/threonine protein kinase
VRSDGTVKVLDFGLAKAMDPMGATSPTVSQSPTITTPAMMTGVGVILGTAAYMAPEQAKGRAADTRSDVWAFGCVLYEMLTGKRAFEGDDVTDTLAAVLRSDPDWTVLPADTPSSIRLLLKRCLAKDRKQRIADISNRAFPAHRADNRDTPPWAFGCTGYAARCLASTGLSRSRGRLRSDDDCFGGARDLSLSISGSSRDYPFFDSTS